MTVHLWQAGPHTFVDLIAIQLQMLHSTSFSDYCAAPCHEKINDHHEFASAYVGRFRK